MTDLQTTLRQLATTFAERVLTAISTVSIAELAAIDDTTRRSDTIRRGDAADQLALRADPTKRRGAPRGRGGRIAGKGRADAREAILVALRGTSGGLRSEQLQTTLGVGKGPLLRSLNKAIAAGEIKKRGQRRGTTYFTA